MPTKFLKVNPKVIFIFAFTICIGAVWAGDERSIKDLRDALVKLAPNVDPAEAELLSVTAHTTSRTLAREYRIVLNPEFQNFLINIGVRKRGYCAHYARDIGARLKELKLKTLVLHWGAAYAGTSGEDNCLVVTARHQPFQDGIILDAWRRAGRLFWSAVTKDREYELEQHYGRSGITAWKEDVHETAWLQDYGPSERKPTKSTSQR
jgi:hypothetical protein